MGAPLAPKHISPNQAIVYGTAKGKIVITLDQLQFRKQSAGKSLISNNDYNQFYN